jgi:L-alanine-DL-glutamate epimerase-like enolase superfamily enzyme
MQLAAAVPYLDQPGQSLLRWYADDVIEPLFAPRHNRLPIPDGPGLGLRPNPAALLRCEERYRQDGVITQLGEPGAAHYRRFQGQ